MESKPSGRDLILLLYMIAIGITGGDVEKGKVEKIMLKKIIISSVHRGTN
jgi:hypothetical protein